MFPHKFNRNGFTLVEALLAVAVIGVLLLMLIPSVISIIKKNNEKACISTRDSILAAAKLLVSEYKYEIFTCGEKEETVDIFISDLYDYGYLKDTVVVDEKFPDVTVTYNCVTKKFSYNYEDENVVDCES